MTFKTLKKSMALLLAVLIAAGSIAAFAEEKSTDYSAPYGAVLNYLHSSAPIFGSVGGEWKVFALARSGRYDLNSAYFTDYYHTIEQYVATVGSNTLNSSKSTENSRVVLAVTSIGKDARSVAGYDLTEPIKDLNYDKKQGINGVIYALLALDAWQGYASYSEKSPLVEFILAREISGGGWALSGNTPDPDVTAAAITALAPYSSASAAINRAVSALSDMQNEYGGFASMNTYNCESCAQVTVALSTIGINADTDSRFIKNGNSALAALISFYTSGGFAHLPGGSLNGMASEQAAYALCAYDRLRTGKSDLYNMNDVAPQPTATPTPTPTPRPTATPTPRPTATPTPRPTATPTVSATADPTPVPTEAVTAAPTALPSSAADSATQQPTGSPAPTAADTEPARSADVVTDLPTDEPVEATELTDGPDDTDEPAFTPEPADDNKPESDGDAPSNIDPITEESAENTDTPQNENKTGRSRSTAFIAAACALAVAGVGAAAVIIIEKRRVQ